MDNYLTVPEVAKRLRFSTWHVYKLIKRGKLVASRPGGWAVRVSESELERFLEPPVVKKRVIKNTFFEGLV